jgi:hypothetical protein
VKGESYYIEAPHNLPVFNDALRGIITGRPNRTNRGGAKQKALRVAGWKGNAQIFKMLGFLLT